MKATDTSRQTDKKQKRNDIFHAKNKTNSIAYVTVSSSFAYLLRSCAQSSAISISIFTMTAKVCLFRSAKLQKKGKKMNFTSLRVESILLSPLNLWHFYSSFVLLPLHEITAVIRQFGRFNGINAPEKYCPFVGTNCHKAKTTNLRSQVYRWMQSNWLRFSWNLLFRVERNEQTSQMNIVFSWKVHQLNFWWVLHNNESSQMLNELIFFWKTKRIDHHPSTSRH